MARKMKMKKKRRKRKKLRIRKMGRSPMMAMRRGGPESMTDDESVVKKIALMYT
jgi:uncharacterized protein YggL (DUF469 family)